MHPILFTIPGLNLDIRAYGMAMAMAFIINIWLATRRALKERIDPDLVLNTSFWIIIGTLVGGRVLYVITKWSNYYPDNLLDAVKVWQGGLVFYGGFLGSFIAAVLYVKVFSRKTMLPVCDILAPVVGLGLAIHRTFGCFLNGCCYGSPTTVPWGVHFPMNHPSIRLYGEHAIVHPAQLYEALNGLCMFYVLILWRKYVRRSYGELLGLMFMVYAVNRYLIEIVRGDDSARVADAIQMLGMTFSTSQFIGLLVFPMGLAFLLYARFWGQPLGTDAGGKASPFYKPGKD